MRALSRLQPLTYPSAARVHAPQKSRSIGPWCTGTPFIRRRFTDVSRSTMPAYESADGSSVSQRKSSTIVLPSEPNDSSMAWQQIGSHIQPGHRCSAIAVYWDKLELQVVKEDNEPIHDARGWQSGSCSAKERPAMAPLTQQQQQQQQTSRLVLRHGDSSFLAIRFEPLYSSARESRKAAAYIEKVLKGGVHINSQHYYFIGSSQGQLRERTAVLYRCASSAEAWQMLQSWGRFGDFKNVAKLYKRVALLFSGVTPLLLNPAGPQTVSSHHDTHGISMSVIDDIERDGFTFTDGCGIISHRLAVRVCQARGPIRVHTTKYKPSVFQIRFKGFKGIVHVDTPAGDYMTAAAAAVGAVVDVGSTDLLLRKSMLKVKDVADSTFGLVEMSQPYKTAYLNQQFVMLLSALGVPDEAFLQLQQQYFEELDSLCWNGPVATKYLLANQQFDLAETVVAWDGATAAGFPSAVAKQLHAIQSREIRGCSKRQGSVNISTAPRLDDPDCPKSAAQLAAGTEQIAANILPAADHNSGGGSGGRTRTKHTRNHSSASAASQLRVGNTRSTGSSASRPQNTTGGTDKVLAAADMTSCSSTPAATADEVESLPSTKLRFRVDRSRMVFGIPDPTGKLQYGQVFFQPLVDGEPTVLTAGCVIVARSPSYHPGDVRVLEPIHVDELTTLKDVLVFPVNGHRPHADECSGGDYDGDQFFVCWDERLFPSKQHMERWPPLDYSAGTESVNARVDHASLVHYFATYDKHLLGRLNSYYMRWAELKGVDCIECIKLAVLFAKGVDAVKTGDKTAVPDYLRPPRLPYPERTEPWGSASDDSSDLNTNATTGGRSSSSSIGGGRSNTVCLAPLSTCDASSTSSAAPTRRVWVQLMQHAQQFVQAWQQQRIATAALSDITCGLTLGDMQELLVSRDVTAREYDLLRLAVRWHQQHGAEAGVQLSELVEVLDFGKMTAQQRAEAVLCGVPKELVNNDLTRSQLLSGQQIAALGALGQGATRWRLYYEGALNSTTSWHSAITSIFSAATKFHKKLLVLQTHKPPQTIVLYLPHLYPGEGVYPCATPYSSGQQQLAAMTWAMGPEGYISKQVLTGHQIDLDFRDKRLQIYRPRPLKQGEQAVAPRLGDARANSYLWLKVMRTPQEVQPGKSGMQRYRQQQQQAVVQHDSFGWGRGRGGRGGTTTSSRGGSQGRGWGGDRGRGQYAPGQSQTWPNNARLATQPWHKGGNALPAPVSDVLQLSVDVLRFEPGRKSFNDMSKFFKTTKECVSRCELYVVSCGQHLEHPTLELPGTWDAFRTTRPEQQADGQVESVSRLVASSKHPGIHELDAAQLYLQQLLPGACCIEIPAANASDSSGSNSNMQSWPELATVNRPQQVSNAAAATAPDAPKYPSFGTSPVAPAAAVRSQNTTATAVGAALATTQAAAATYNMLVDWATDNKLEAAVTVLTQKCGCTTLLVPPAPPSMWPQLLSAAARLHRSDLATNIIECMQQQQVLFAQHGLQYTAKMMHNTLGSSSSSSDCRSSSGAPAGSKATSDETAVSNIRNAVSLCHSLGLLHCCPAVAFSLWKWWLDHQQQQQQQQQASATGFASLSDDTMQQLVLASIRCASEQPETAGRMLQQLLASLPAPWSPSQLKDLMTSVVTDCSNRRVAAAVLLPCIAAAGAAAAAAGDPDSRASSQAAAQYQLHWSSAMTLAVLAELQDSHVGSFSAVPATGGPCDIASHINSTDGTSNINSSSHSATMWDLIGAQAGLQNVKDLASQAEPDFISYKPQSTRGVIGNRGTTLRNMMVIMSVQQGVADNAPEQSTPQLDGGAASNHHTHTSTAVSTTQPLETGQASSATVDELCCNLPCKVTFSTSSGGMPQQQQLLVGDIVSISAQNVHAQMMRNPGHFIEGRVTAADSLGVTVSLPWTPCGLRDRPYQISRVGNIVTFERCLSGLETMTCQLKQTGADANAQLTATASSQTAAGASNGIKKPTRSGCESLQQIVTTTWHLQQQQKQEEQSAAFNNGGNASSSTSVGISCSSSSQATSVIDFLRAAGEEHVFSCAPSAHGLLSSTALNPAQRAAVEAAAVQQLTLIWGPPGTGKTHTIAQLLLVMLKQQLDQGHASMNPILVCAETHTATDNIALKLLMAAQQLASEDGMKITKKDILRVDDMGRVASELKSCTVDALGDEATNAAGFLGRKEIRKLFRDKLLVFSTCAAAGSGLLLAAAAAGVTFERVVVDEASQVLEPCCLLPTLLGPAKQLVLVGDHKQLGPSADQKAVTGGAAGSGTAAADAGVSLFE